MDALLGTFAILAFLICLIAVVFPFKPVAFLNTRKKAGIGLAVSFLLFIVAVSMTDTKVSDETVVTVQNSASSSAKSKSELTTEAKTEQAQALMQQVTSAVASCDNFGKRIAESAEQADMYAMYEATDAGEPVCYEASRLVRNISPPEFVSREGRKKIETALKQMSDAYSQKAYSFSKMKAVANGDLRPSAISEAKQAGESVNGMVLVALAGLYGTLQEEGADGEKLLGETSSQK